jgi:hypothetical protein
MDFDQLLRSLRENPSEIEYDAVLALVDELYEFTPVKFTNGDLVNEAGRNLGSCKILAFAKLVRLTEEQTLNCFGSYYRDDVLKYPNHLDHPNIRNFMKAGWQGVNFEGVALRMKD